MQEKFLDRLRSCRKTAGLSQRALAKEIGLTDAAVNMMEKGKRYPSFEVLIALCRFFEVSADYLLGLSDDPARR